MTELKPLPLPLNCFLVLCKTRKKFDKYIKINKIRKTCVIDIKKMMEEEGILPEDLSSSSIFKLLILKKINLAKEKKKDIYYIPCLQYQSRISNLFNIKNLIKDTHNFNMLYFYEDFEKGKQPEEILNKIDEFDVSQLIKDY